MGPLIGTNKVFNPKKQFLISVNVPGSPYGSFSPYNTMPDDAFKDSTRGEQRPYFFNFPFLSPRDIVHIYRHLMIKLRISSIHLMVGGSMGGQHVFQWLVSYPDTCRHAIIIAANPKTSQWMIASNYAQREALMNDATFFEAEKEGSGEQGLKLAREIAFLSYRSPLIFSKLDSRESLITNTHAWADERGFKIRNKNATINSSIHSYIDYQGKKFVQRFKALNYYYLLYMLDSHDIGKGFASLTHALRTINTDILLIGIDSDLLYTPQELKGCLKDIRHVQYREITSIYGHDAFLIEFKQLEDIIYDYLYQVDHQYSVFATKED